MLENARINAFVSQEGWLSTTPFAQHLRSLRYASRPVFKDGHFGATGECADTREIERVLREIVKREYPEPHERAAFAGEDGALGAFRAWKAARQIVLDRAARRLDAEYDRLILAADPADRERLKWERGDWINPRLDQAVAEAWKAYVTDLREGLMDTDKAIRARLDAEAKVPVRKAQAAVAVVEAAQALRQAAEAFIQASRSPGVTMPGGIRDLLAGGALDRAEREARAAVAAVEPKAA